MSVVFEDNFLLLPLKHQEIWKVIWYFCKKYRASFPSHEKIAQLVGCCRRTVVNAINSFRNFGWLETTKRCFRSSLLFIKEHLLNINPKDRRNYINTDWGEGRGGQPISREELHSDLHTIYSNQKDIETLSDSIPKKEKKYYRPNRVIPEFIKIQGMPPEDWQKLANQFSDRDLFEALQEAKSFSKSVEKIRNKAAWITSKCQEYITKRMKKNENSNSL